jgi:phage gp29-like protein
MPASVLYDQFGREIQPRERARADAREISVATIRDRWSTYPSQGLTPVRLAAIFREADNGDMLRQSELFEEMEEKDAHLYSQLQIRKLAVQGLSREILPVAQDSKTKKIAAFCDEVLDSLEELDDILLDLLDSIAKGYSLCEILWDAGKAETGIRALRWIHPKKITFWNSLTPRILTDENMVAGVDVPPFKCIFHRYKARSGYDTRAGLLRVCGWMYLFKNYAIKDWVAFAEVYGQPLRLGKYDQSASSDDKTQLLTAIRSIGSDAAGIISKATEIEFIETLRTGTLNIYESLANFCDTQMSKAILGQTLTSAAGGDKGQGSYALGKVHEGVRQDLVMADCKSLSRTITQQLLRPLVGYNFGWDAPVPQFRLLFDPPEDLKMVADTYKVLVDMGQPISQEHVGERFKVPLPEAGETPLRGGSLRQARDERGEARGPWEQAKHKPSVSDPRQIIAGEGPGQVGFDPAQLGIEDLAERLLAEHGGEASDWIGPVIAHVRQAENYEQLMEGLYPLHGKMDTEQFAELLRRALFAADLWGYLSAGTRLEADRD